MRQHHTRKPPPSWRLGSGEIGSHKQRRFLTRPVHFSRQVGVKRSVRARVPLGADELVLSVDDRDRLDIRLWTCTAGVRMASRLTLHRNDVEKLVAALQHALREEAAT